MKNILAILLLGATFCTSAQNIKTADLNSQDLQNIISNLFDIEIQKYDLSKYLDKRCKVSLYIDEYSRTPNDNLTKERVWRISMGQNRKYIENADDREQLQEDSNFNKESGELTLIESLTLAIRIESDSTTLLSLLFMPNKAGATLPLEVISLEQSYMNRPQYGTRPFKFNSDTNVGDEIPLLLYGSHYYDEEAKVMRLCGESEIDSDLDSDIIKRIPHFYVVGIIFKETDSN